MNERLHGLEAVRGVAPLLVAWTHAQYLSQTDTRAALLFDKGYLAVDLFFVLSGFVLARTYERNMPATADFLTMRFARLWSLVAIGVALGALHFALRDLGFMTLLPHLVAGLLILPMIGFVIALNPPAWSIFFELVANGLHASVFSKVGTGVLCALVVLSAAILMIFAGASGLNVGQGDTFLLGVPRVVMGYCLGIVLYRLNADRTHVPAAWAWPIVALVPITVAAATVYVPPEVEVLFALAICPAVVLGSLSLKASRIAAFLGAVSFPVYAVHFPVQWLLILWGADFWGALLFSLLGSVLVALVCDRRSRAAFAAMLPAALSPPRQLAEGS